MPKIPEISVGSQMKRSISVSSEYSGIFGITFDQTGATEICRCVFDKPVHCPASLRKGNEKWLESDSSWLAHIV